MPFYILRCAMCSQSTHVSILICQELLFFSFPEFCLKTAKQSSTQKYIYIYVCINTDTHKYTCTHTFLSM